MELTIDNQTEDPDALALSPDDRDREFLQQTQNPLGIEVLETFDFAKFGTLARALQILLATGQVDYAVSAVRQFAQATCAEQLGPESPLASAIPLRYANAIETAYARVFNLQAFAALSDTAIQSIPGCSDAVIEWRDRIRDCIKYDRPITEWIGDELDLWFDFMDEPMPSWTDQLLRSIGLQPVSGIGFQPVLPSTSTTKGVSNVSTGTDLLTTMRALFDQSADALRKIDQAIAAKENEIAELKQMRKMLERVTSGTRSTDKRQTAAKAETSERYKSLADQMVQLMTVGRQYKARQLEQMLTEAGVTVTYVIVGKVAARDPRFKAAHGLIELA